MKLIAWLALSVAVVASVTANVSFKFALTKASANVSGHPIVSFLMQPSTWIGLCAAAVLLANYVLAIRDIGLGFSYAIVTSLSLVLVTITSAIAFQERLNLTIFVGMGLIIFRIAILASAIHHRRQL
jgi:multidrug transporter EmrE-like cation transporter